MLILLKKKYICFIALQVLQRIVNENGGELVIATLCLIEVSRFGLLETELLELLAADTVVPSKGAKYTPFKNEIQRMPVAKVRCQLMRYLKKH